MSLSDLSASELARIDAICLEYEQSFRSGSPPPISEVVANHGGEHAELLQGELELVREELENEAKRNADTDALSAADTRYFASVELPSAGDRLGPYLIEETLGRGGMGVVFAAVDTRLDRKVAIKVLAVETAKRRDLTERFEREARAVAAISHPNIVELFDIGVANGLPYAVMEYLDGELLDAWMKRGPIPADEVRRIGAQVADALATSHEAKVVHRDLKPHNIMLVRRRGGVGDSAISETPADTTIAKLFDFGLSRVPRNVFGSAEETGDGIVLGTPGYMAPEQARGEPVTPAADIFSLGCVLYEAFYGRLAFDGPTKAARFSATINQEPEADPIRRRDDVELADLIQACLQKDASNRPPSAATVASQLRQRISSVGKGGEAGSTDAAGKLARRSLLAVACAGVAGGLGWTLWSRRETDQVAGIQSIAVLSFTDESAQSVTSTSPPEPIGDRQLERGEQLSALLVHELIRLSHLTVPQFRPIVAEKPSEFREVGAMLEVDALLTGRIRKVQEGTAEFLELDIRIVSAETGDELWNKRFPTDSADSLLEQSKLATEIASAIGHRLTSSADELAPPNAESFNCLVDARTRSDPDSLAGLEMALMCFQKARRADRRFADPVAGVALTSITLAAQTDTEKSIELIRQARVSSEEALELDPKSVDARLAVAMLDWQTVGRYQQAERALQELMMVAPNNWQVRHQYGLLLLTTGRLGDAAAALREASQLNPLSVLVKVDRARAEWYRGNLERALRDATRIRDKHDRAPLARGLLVDIYEHQERYDLAAEQHDDWPATNDATAEAYFERRQEQLSQLPYGPFGDAANAAIRLGRTGDGITDWDLAELTDPMPPMVPLLLAVHPSFAAARLLPRAQELLPT